MRIKCKSAKSINHLALAACILLISLSSFAQSDSGYISITKITINGNFKTLDRIILIASGLTLTTPIQKELFKSKLDEAKNNIQNTDLFNSVVISNVPLNDSFTELIITVAERWYLWPLPILENADPNFNTWWENKDFSRINYGIVLMKQNFRGRGEELGGLIQLGYSKRFALLYDVPYASPKGKSGIKVYAGYDQQNQITIGTVNNKRIFHTGAGGNTREQWQVKLGFLQRHKVVTTHTLWGAYKNYKVKQEVITANPEYLIDSAKQIGFFELSYLFKHDKRDYKHYPLKGYYLDARATQSGIGITKDVALSTLEVTAKKFLHIKGRFYAAFGGFAIGTLQKDIPYVLQKGLGYDHYVRGYEYYILDGNHYGVLKANIKYELIKKRTHLIPFIKNSKFNKFYYATYLNIFSDFGYVQNNFSGSSNSLSNQWLSSFGLGLDFLTYYDTVIRVEFSVNKQRESGFFLHFTQPI
jgi:hypothetical protein